MNIHPTAIVHPEARIDPSVEIGPYSIIGQQVRIGPKTWVGPHVVIDGDTTIGAQNRIFQFASVGAPPQDLKYAGEPTKLVIGDRNQIREFATVHRGTVQGGGVTRIGNGCLLMANCHVAHDCQLADGVILANSVALGGHVHVEDHVTCGGLSAVHQFTRLGRHAFISGGAMVGMDIPPYCTAQGDRAELAGLNTVGLARSGFTTEQVTRIKGAYKLVFRSGLGLREALGRVAAEFGGNPEIDHFVRFIEGSERGITR
jgi:UDP-N-acetylglucosamine acyltransferase